MHLVSHTTLYHSLPRAIPTYPTAESTSGPARWCELWLVHVSGAQENVDGGRDAWRRTLCHGRSEGRYSCHGTRGCFSPLPPARNHSISYYSLQQKVPPANEEADAPLFQNRASLPVNQGGLPTFQENPKQAQLAMQSLGLTSLSRPKSVPTITEQAALPTANEGTSQQLGGTATRTFATKFSGGALSKTSRSSPLFGKEKGGAAAKAATTLPKESTQGPSNMSLLGSMMRNKTSVVYTNPNERRPPEAGLMDPNTPVAMDRMEYNLRTPQAATQMWNHHEDASAATVGDGMGGGPFSPPVAIFNEGAGQKSANFVTPAPAPRETGATNASPSSLADEWMGATHMTEAEMLDETPRWQLVQEEFSQKMQRCGDITTSFDDQLLSATLLLETAHSDLLGWEARLLDQLDEMEEAEGAVDDMLHAFDS